MDGWIRLGTKLETKEFDAQIKEVEAKLEKLEAEKKEWDTSGAPKRGEYRQLQVEIEKTKNKLVDLNKSQQNLEKANLSDVQNSIDKVGDSTSKVIKKVGKWALAVFGVRSAYMFVRQSASTLAQYNEQIATDLEYIQYSLASMLQPIIEGLINLVYKLLSYVNLIAKAWFGVDLFAKASADSFNKGAKSAEKMKKSLAGFDEMNVLNDNGTTGALGGVPSVDLSKSLESVDVEKFKSFWDEIIQFWEKDYAEFFSNVGGNWSMFFEGLGTTLKGFYDVFKGVFQLIRGVVEVVVGLFQNDFEKIKEAWSLMGEGLYNIIVGILEIILGVFSTVLGAIKGLFLDLVTGIYNTVIVPIGKFFAMLWDGITSGFKVAINFIKNTFMSVVDFFRNIINTIVGLFRTIGTKVGDAISGAFKAVVNGVLNAIESILNFPIKSINKLINVINKVPGVNLGTLPTFYLPRLAVGGIVNMPGKGVPVGGAIAGEVSKEGVIPLTNSQAMQELGQTIGRYITINANITNTMNGRVISRELQKINTNNDFAMNR